MSGQCQFTVPAGAAGQQFELKFQASASGVPTTINLTVVVKVVSSSPPPPPEVYQPVTGKTDDGGKFTVSIAPTKTVSGKLTICTVTPIANQTFTLTPVVAGFDGGAIGAFDISVPGYEDVRVTEFSKVDLFIITTYDLKTLCLKPKPPIPPPPEEGEGGGPAGCFHAMWTHGSGVQLENPEAAVSVTRFGWGTRVVGKPNTGGWFHFAIPTPVIGTCYRSAVGGEIGFRYRLLRVLIRVHTSGDDVRVRSVHVWDGDIRLQMYDGLTVTKGPLTRAFDVPARPSVVYGIGVSIRVEFGSAGGWVTFIAAGGDFLLSDACSCK